MNKTVKYSGYIKYGKPSYINEESIYLCKTKKNKDINIDFNWSNSLIYNIKNNIRNKKFGNIARIKYSIYKSKNIKDSDMPIRMNERLIRFLYPDYDGVTTFDTNLIYLCDLLKEYQYYYLKLELIFLANENEKEIVYSDGKNDKDYYDNCWKTTYNGRYILNEYKTNLGRLFDINDDDKIKVIINRLENEKIEEEKREKMQSTGISISFKKYEK